MKKRNKRILSKALSLALAACLSAQLLPAEVLAAEMEEQQARAELDAQRELVTQLEEELELLMPEELETSASAPALLAANAATYDCYDGEILCGVFSFDTATGTITDFTQSAQAPYILTIPETIDGVAVKSMASGAFTDATFAETVVLSSGIKTIPDYAFQNCSALKQIDLSNVQSIGDRAFANCAALEELHFYTDSLYGDEGSRDLRLGDRIVSGCTNLTKIVFHGDYSAAAMDTGSAEPTQHNAPFEDCDSIREVVFDGAPTNIGRNLFRNASFLKNLDFIPDSVRHYNPYAFYGSGLTEVTIPAHIKTVDYACFMNCTELTALSVHCPVMALVPSAYNSAYDDYSGYIAADGMSTNYPMFGGAFAGEDVVIDLPESWTEIPRGLFRKTALQNTQFLQDMPNLQRIGAFAFADCEEMTEILIPGTVTELGYNAFEDSMAKVYSLTIPASVTTLTQGSYYDFDNLLNHRSNWQHQFYGGGSNDALREVYILNPDLELNADTLTSDTAPYSTHIFNYKDYRNEDGKRLTIHGVVGSTAEALCEASDGRYVFAELAPAGAITLKVMAGDTDVTDRVGVRWENNGALQSESAVLIPYAENVRFTYFVELPEDLQASYNPPEVRSVLSGADAQTITIQLVPVQDVLFTGTVNVDGAHIKLKQTHNGVVSYAETTAEDGTFALNAGNVYTEITVSAPGYYAECVVISWPEATNTVTITMRELPATTTQLVAQVTPAVGSGYILDDLSGISFAVTDGVTGRALPFRVQQNQLILEAAVGSTHPLKLSVTAVDEKLKLAVPTDSISFTLESGAFISLNGQGVFTLNAASASAQGQYVWVYSDGKLKHSFLMNAGSMTSDPMEAGTYTLVVIDRTSPVVNPASITDLAELGLWDHHYYSTNITVEDGAVTAVSDFEVPELTDITLSRLFSDMFESIKLSTTSTVPMVGQEYHLILRYQLKDTYRGSDTVKTFTLTIPQGSKLLEVYTPRNGDTFTPELNSVTSAVTVQTTADEGTICLAVQATQPDPNGVFRATMSCQGKIAAERELNYKLNVESIRILSISTSVQSAENFGVIVKAVPDSLVNLYVDGEELDYTFANLSGTARFEVDLPAPAYVGRSWEISADMSIDEQSYTTPSQTVTVAGDEIDPVITSPGGQKLYINRPSIEAMTYVCEANANGLGDDWIVDVAEGYGGKIANGVIEIVFRSSSTGESCRIPCYRVGFSDTFRGHGIVIEHNYISVSYDLDMSYWTEREAKGTGVSLADQMAYHNDLRSMFLQYEAPVEMFTDTENYLKKLEQQQNVPQTALEDIPEFQALSREEKEEVRLFEAEQQMKMEAVQTENLQLAEQLLGRTVDWTKTGDELLAELGYTVRALEEGELDTYQNDPNFVAMLVGSNTVYYYADRAQTVYVDVDAGTVTTMELPSVGGATYRTRAADSVENDAITLQNAVNGIITTFTQMSNGIEAEIAVLEETCSNYVEHMDKFKFEHPGHAAAAARLTVLKSFQKFLPVLNGLLNIATVVGLSADLWGIRDKLNGLRAQLPGTEGKCYQATANLISAYEDLAAMIFVQAMSAVGQMSAMLAFTSAAMFSRLASVLGIVITSVAGMAADLYIGYKNDQAKARAQHAERVQADACREEEEEEDEIRPGEMRVDPIFDPSGYVYEAVFSNRVEGATVTTYYRDDEKNEHFWYASVYDQENPLITNENGFYQWFVPRGEWKVVAELDGYKTADTTDIYGQEKMREGRDDITADGWHTVLPPQMEVHIPMEKEEKPRVWDYFAYSDDIFIEFDHYMKEETVPEAVSILMDGEIYSGDELTLTWLDQELSDHYYGRTFASKLMISRADGGAWHGTITVRFTPEAENYAGTPLECYDEDYYMVELDVFPTPAVLDAPERAEVYYADKNTVAVRVLDESGVPVPGVWIYTETNGIADLAYFDDYDSTWYYDTEQYYQTGENGWAEIVLRGYTVGKDTLTVQVFGRSETLEIPVYVSRDPAEGTTLPVVPDVSIGGVKYTGRDNEIEVAAGTVVSVSGMPGETLYYSVGMDSCPCTTDDQIKIENGQFTISQSGYYKIAAYRDGEYSDRVHLNVTTADVVGDGAARVTSITPTGDGMNITVTGVVSSYSGETVTGDVWCGVYDAEDRQIGVQRLAAGQTASSGASVQVSGEVSLSSAWNNGAAVRLFYLQQGTLIPLAESVRYTGG